jgi:undecaprenyl-diphosphatase
MLCSVSIIQAIILGAIQGLSEFLPISSSGHLVVVPELFGIPKPSLAFDVLLHLATVAAAVAYFYPDIGRIILSFVAPKKLSPEEVKRYRQLTLWLAAGTVPVVLVGLTLDSFVESLFDSTLAVGIFLMLTSLIMAGAEVTYAVTARRRMLGQMGLIDTVIVGLFQALAIAPGLSRSGATMSGGIYLGFERETAARFAFLLGIPASLGAGLFKVKDLAQGFGGSEAGAYVAGGLTALVVGFAAVYLMIRFLRGHRLVVFSVYTFILGAFVVVLSLA